MSRVGRATTILTALALTALSSPAVADPGVAERVQAQETAILTEPAQVADREVGVLRTNERLNRGDALVSPSGRYRLQVDANGLLQLIERSNWLSSGEIVHPISLLFTEGDGVDFLLLQSDGNLVAYGAGGSVRVNFSTNGTGAQSVRLQDDRNIVLFGAQGQVVADLATYNDLLLVPGMVLLPGDQVRGENGFTRLVMQTDGNLVLYQGSTALWASGTVGNPGAGAILQADGNLVVYSSAQTGGRALWSTRTAGSVDRLVVLVVEDTEVSVSQLTGFEALLALWGSNWATSTVLPGDELDLGDRRTSSDGRCTLVMQADTNLVQYCAGRPTWATGVLAPADPPSVETALMQLDGNFVVYREKLAPVSDEVTARPLFNTRSRVPGSYVVVQGDGNTVVLSPQGRPVWSHRTGLLR